MTPINKSAFLAACIEAGVPPIEPYGVLEAAERDKPAPWVFVQRYPPSRDDDKTWATEDVAFSLMVEQLWELIEEWVDADPDMMRFVEYRRADGRSHLLVRQVGQWSETIIAPTRDEALLEAWQKIQDK